VVAGVVAWSGVVACRSRREARERASLHERERENTFFFFLPCDLSVVVVRLTIERMVSACTTVGSSYAQCVFNDWQWLQPLACTLLALFFFCVTVVFNTSS
jgi:hypothetical protein